MVRIVWFLSSSQWGLERISVLNSQCSTATSNNRQRPEKEWKVKNNWQLQAYTHFVYQNKEHHFKVMGFSQIERQRVVDSQPSVCHWTYSSYTRARKITVESKEMFIRFDILIPFAVSISNRHKIHTSTQQNKWKIQKFTRLVSPEQLPHPHLPLHHFYEHTGTFKFAMNSLFCIYMHQMLQAPLAISAPEHKHPTVITHDSNKTMRFLFSKLLSSRAQKACSQCSSECQQMSSANMISKMNWTAKRKRKSTSETESMILVLQCNELKLKEITTT